MARAQDARGLVRMIVIQRQSDTSRWKAPVEILLLLVVVAAIVGLTIAQRNKAKKARHVQSREVTDEITDARRWTARLDGQVRGLSGAEFTSAEFASPAEPSRQAIADADVKLSTATTLLAGAKTVRQARAARAAALEGLYYVRAARESMALEPGPPLPGLDGQDIAGAVTQDRAVEFEGRVVSASPAASSRTPHFHPGGRVVSRPVPAGWYSERWWGPALAAGAWDDGSTPLFTALFAGMAGVGYGAEAFEEGYGDAEYL